MTSLILPSNDGGTREYRLQGDTSLGPAHGPPDSPPRLRRGTRHPRSSR